MTFTCHKIITRELAAIGRTLAANSAELPLNKQIDNILYRERRKVYFCNRTFLNHFLVKGEKK